MKGRKTRNLTCAGRQLHLERTKKEKRTEAKPTEFNLCNLPADAQEEELRDLFSSVGELLEVELRSEKNSAKLQFAQVMERKLAEDMVQAGHMVLRGAVLRERSRSPQKKRERTAHRPHLVIKNLMSAEEETLKIACEVVGEVRRLKMIYDKNGDFKRCAFVEYADANVVEDARDFLHNTSLMGETIKVERYLSPTPERETRETKKRKRSRKRAGSSRRRSPSPPPWHPPFGPPRPPVHLPQFPPFPMPLPPPRPSSTPISGPSSGPSAGPSKRPRPSAKPSCASHLEAFQWWGVGGKDEG
eukprot:symbB.v1.2.019189.t1/scaffold1561.1/size111715/5